MEYDTISVFSYDSGFDFLLIAILCIIHFRKKILVMVFFLIFMRRDVEYTPIKSLSQIDE